MLFWELCLCKLKESYIIVKIKVQNKIIQKLDSNSISMC